MNLETLKKINYLLLRKSENIYSSSLFRTDLDLYSLSMLKVNKLYIKNFKETINYIMGIEKIYLDDTLNFIETFGSNHTSSNINAIKNKPINIKNIIDKNIKSLENLKFNNDEEKEKTIKLFKSFNYKEIYELEEYKKISKIILDHISFKNKLFDLTNEEADLKEIKKNILNNYSMIGITIDKNGKFNTAHLKDDEYIDEKTSDIKNIISMIKEESKNKLKKF